MGAVVAPPRGERAGEGLRGDVIGELAADAPRGERVHGVEVAREDASNARGSATAAAIASASEPGGGWDVLMPAQPATFAIVPRALTGDQMVTYDPRVDDDRVFKALADPSRRQLLDLLFARDGRTLTELESQLDMTRFGVMKHLRVLEAAGLVVARRSGREKLHFLNPVPIRLVHDRWIDKYTEHRVAALADLKAGLEDTA